MVQQQPVDIVQRQWHNSASTSWKTTSVC